MYAVTFYSYKGGVGRSLLVANCALYLAQLGLRVVALDLDLEAPGLHYKFRSSLGEAFSPSRGLIDLVDDYATKNQLYESLSDVSFDVPLGDPMLEPNESESRGWLRVIPAGSAPSLDYWRRIANIDWKKFLYDESATGVEFFLDLRDRIAEELQPDLLLIDSRTGITEMGNVATSMLADKVVCIVADSAENLEGSRAVLRGLRRHRRLSDGGPLEMKIAVSRPHHSLPLSERLEKIRAFLEEPAEMLDATLNVGTPYPLAYDPDVEEKERLVLGADLGRMGQLSLDYITIAEEIVPESIWSGIRRVSASRIQTPYPFCVWNYSRLALEQPGIPVDGLYRLGRRCFIVIPGFGPEMRADDGKSLSEWFEAEITVGIPIEIAARVPQGALRVPDPSLEDLVALRDAWRTTRQIDVELCLGLPRTFPEFACGRGENSSVIVEVGRPLRADERAALQRELVSLGYGPVLRPVIRVNPDVAKEEPKFRPPNRQGDIELIPSRRLPSAFSSAVRELVAQDEDIWMSSRLKIHRGEISDPSAVLPSWRRSSRARLFVGFQVTDVHRLLPFCDQLVITLPLKGTPGRNLADMGFTPEDLVTLASEERIIILLPQAIDRYEPSLLNELAQRAPKALVCSRSLCAATMIELRRRLHPWFVPGFDLRVRLARLNRAAARVSTPGPSPFFFLHPATFARFLSHIWAREEWHTHEKGAMASGFLGGGFGTLLSDHVEHQLKRELIIESSEAGSAVEMAAALSAMVVPMHHKRFSLLGLTTLGADLFSFLSDFDVRSIPPITLDLPDREMPTIELGHFDSEELKKMRALLADMTESIPYSHSDATDATEACRGWLTQAGALKKPDGKLTLKVPGGEFETAAASLGHMSGVAGARLMREWLAGADLAERPDMPDAPSSFPSIVVGELQTSGSE